MPPYVFPRLNHRWELEKAEPVSYSNDRSKLALVCARFNDLDGAPNALHPPKNFLATAATQMDFGALELNVIGRRPANSRMNERHGRSARANELLLRNAVIQKMAPWRNTVDSVRLPGTVQGSERTGKDPSTFTAAVAGPNSPTHAALPIANSTQDPAAAVANPPDDSIAELNNVPPQVGIPAEQS